MIREAVEAFNIKSVELEGYEADDLIATYAKLGIEAGMNVKILSSDKDMMQLIGLGIELYDAFDFSLVDNEKVMQKFGVTPDKVIDVQSLAGDSSDNVPGVKGIGPKTASSLINDFGSLEGIYENLDKISKPRTKALLEEHKDLAFISKKLVTLCNHAPVEVGLKDLEIINPDFDKIMDFMRANEFKSLMNSLPNWQEKREEVIRKVKSESAKYITVDEEKDLKEWVERAINEGVVAFDTETDSLDSFSANLVGFSLCIKEGEACYVPLNHKAKQESLFEETSIKPKQIDFNKALEILKPLLTDESVMKVGHNIKYDMNVLVKYYGDDFFIKPASDTMLMSYTLDGAKHRHNMDELALKHFGHTTIKYDDVTGTGKSKISFDLVGIKEATKYAAEDAYVTMMLYNFFKDRLVKEKSLSIYEYYDRPLLNVLSQMERNGVLIDAIKLNDLSKEFSLKISELDKEIQDIAGVEFNVNSPSQLGEVLFDKMGLLGGKKSSKTGKYSTDVDVLEELANNGEKIAEKVLEYRGFSKIKSTYTDALPTFINKRTGRVHTSYLQTGTSTGRLSSSDPNLQNIPIRSEDGRKIRQAFIAKKGHKILSADYSQIELRIIAEVAEIKALKQAFIDNVDIHAVTASKVYGIPIEGMDPTIRRSAKAINFGIIYGISAFGLAKQLNVSRTEANDLINSYFKQFPELKNYMDSTENFAKQNGFVETLFGRKCYINGINDKNSGIRNYALRAAINAPIQGSASDLMRIAMINMYKEFKDEMIMQVHDELVFEIKQEEAETKAKRIKEIMEQAYKMSVPLIAEVGIGDNWDMAH
ncbi:MAG: DNA polymerase I [Alphaproteobacteria bacterium ADurb.Bin438]|nr:MAG: DNA polymerase I [Alphaproteobacteria bacterium ADurb.Bin438]